MLSFGRDPGQYIVIGDDIVVQVVSMDGDLRLAIEAPREIPIVRGEIYERENPVPLCVQRHAKEPRQKGKTRKAENGAVDAASQQKPVRKVVVRRG